MLLVGVELGGTSSSVCVASCAAPGVLLARHTLPTSAPESTLRALAAWAADQQLAHASPSNQEEHLHHHQHQSHQHHHHHDSDHQSHQHEHQPVHAGVVAVGIASFGPVCLDVSSPDYGRVTTTPKPLWAGADVVGAFRSAFPHAKIAFDTDVNAPALIEASTSGLSDLC